MMLRSEMWRELEKIPGVKEVNDKVVVVEKRDESEVVGWLPDPTPE